MRLTSTTFAKITKEENKANAEESRVQRPFSVDIGCLYPAVPEASLS